MIDETVARVRTLDLVDKANQRDALLNQLELAARSIMPPFAWGILVVAVAAGLALYFWRRSEVSVSDLGRRLFGIQRPLTSRSQLRPRATRLSAGVSRHQVTWRH
ncbi:MAG TPA: hypothetical protein VMF06_05505 [Candidatus Limnocylindria bacterium]|jgi:hypothetical protein|nr:hypothetical protein [Candidatus Limnocylindria bacterium]